MTPTTQPNQNTQDAKTGLSDADAKALKGELWTWFELGGRIAIRIPREGGETLYLYVSRSDLRLMGQSLDLHDTLRQADKVRQRQPEPVEDDP